MRRISLTLWHGGLLVLIVWGLFTTLVAAAERFTVTWRAPGLLTLILIVCIEAIVTQRMVVRERQQLEEQLRVRAIEFVVIVLLVRISSLAAQDQPLLASLGPWLREPLRFFGGRFAEYLLWTLAAWGLMTVLTSDVLDWDGDAPAAVLEEGSIEREQIQHEWALSVARYDRRWLLITLMALGASGFALQGVPILATLRTTPRALLPGAAAIVVMIAGLLLHSAGRLSQLRHNWGCDNIQIDATVSRRWGRSGILILIGLMLFAPLVSWIVLIAPPPPLVPVANLLLVIMTIAVSLVVLLLGLLLSPLILLLSLLGGTDRAVMPTIPRLDPPQITETRGDRPLIPALIFWGCMILLIGIALWRYLETRSDLRDALRRWRVLRWLFGWAGEWWSDARGWVTLATAAVRRFAVRRRPRMRRARPRGPQEQLRALYRRMRQAGSRRGVPAAPAQTPYEYSVELSRSLPLVEDDVRGLVETYVGAEYGPRPPGGAELRRARRHWRRLQRWLLRPVGLLSRRSSE